MRIALGIAALLAGVAGPAAAQLGLGAGGAVAFAEHRVRAGGGVEQASGTLQGGFARLAVGSRFELVGEALRGELTADSAGADDRKLTQVVARAAVLPVPWLALVGGVTAQTHATQIARQRWVAARFGAEARLAFVGGAFRGIVRAELMPSVSVSGLDGPNRALAAAAGLEWEAGVLVARLQYEFERYDFPLVGAVARREQLSSLSARLGLRVGKRPSS